MSRVSADGILWFERKGRRRVVTSKRSGGMEYLLYKYWLSAVLLGLFPELRYKR